MPSGAPIIGRSWGNGRRDGTVPARAAALVRPEMTWKESAADVSRMSISRLAMSSVNLGDKQDRTQK